jgi:hypothetical protein
VTEALKCANVDLGDWQRRRQRRKEDRPGNYDITSIDQSDEHRKPSQTRAVTPEMSTEFSDMQFVMGSEIDANRLKKRFRGLFPGQCVFTALMYGGLRLRP